MRLLDYIPALKYGAKILPMEIVNQGILTMGNIYFVKKSTDSDYSTFYGDNYVDYSDGTHSIYNTIQSAVDASTSDRGDIILVHYGKWVEDVAILEKDGLRIFGMGHGTGANDTGTRIRPNDATTKYTTNPPGATSATGAAFHILSRGVEVAGFYFDGGGGCDGIYLGGGLYGGIPGTNSDGDPYTDETASGAWIHHNFFRGGSEGPIGLVMDGAKFGCVIEDNIFERWTYAGIEMSSGNASNECSIIRRNQFIADNASYGIHVYSDSNSGLGCQINDNVFGDRNSHAFTYAIYVTAGMAGVLTIAGNRFCCANTIIATTADFLSGNTYGFAGNAAEDSNYFIGELTAGT